MGAGPRPRRRRGRPASTSSVRRHPRATSRRTRSPLAGPPREVVYIFQREGLRGGSIWWLVLACGHTVARSRSDPKTPSAIAQAMFEPLERHLAPQRVQCHYCGAGVEEHDPGPIIRALGGEAL